jgi:uncharacterized membrane protein YheB (UPF0754 family)
MRRLQKENTFSKIEKKIQVDNITEFPSLSTVSNAIENETKEEKKNYIDMFLVEKEEEKKNVYLPGWLYISMDNDRKVKKVVNGKISETSKHNEEQDVDSLNKTEYNKKAVKVISEMIQNWENYKTWYIELYGAECYEKMYEMVSKDDDISYDEHSEDENLIQDNIFTDEDEDDY